MIYGNKFILVTESANNADTKITESEVMYEFAKITEALIKERESFTNLCLEAVGNSEYITEGGIIDFIKGIFKKIKEMIDKFIGMLKKAFDKFMSLFKKKNKSVKEKAAELSAKAKNAEVVSITNNDLEEMRNVFKASLDDMNDMFKDINMNDDEFDKALEELDKLMNGEIDAASISEAKPAIEKAKKVYRVTRGPKLKRKPVLIETVYPNYIDYYEVKSTLLVERGAINNFLDEKIIGNDLAEIVKYGVGRIKGDMKRSEPKYGDSDYAEDLNDINAAKSKGKNIEDFTEIIKRPFPDCLLMADNSKRNGSIFKLAESKNGLNLAEFKEAVNDAIDNSKKTNVIKIDTSTAKKIIDIFKSTDEFGEKEIVKNLEVIKNNLNAYKQAIDKYERTLTDIAKEDNGVMSSVKSMTSLFHQYADNCLSGAQFLYASLSKLAMEEATQINTICQFFDLCLF